MQMLCLGDDRHAPVIIDHELGRRAFCHFERARRTRRGPRRDKSGQDTRGDQDTACQNGVATTGVEGEAKSRASISPASYAARPASTPERNAFAIATGSAALAIAVFNSTAS